jgi:hypothetical protein
MHALVSVALLLWLANQHIINIFGGSYACRLNERNVWSENKQSLARLPRENSFEPLARGGCIIITSTHTWSRSDAVEDVSPCIACCFVFTNPTCSSITVLYVLVLLNVTGLVLVVMRLGLVPRRLLEKLELVL